MQLTQIITVLGLVLAAGVARADSIRLHDQVGSAGPEVKLREVAELEGPTAQALADTVVGRFGAKDSALSLNLKDVEKTLTDRGVNWGRLNLRGFARCQVQRLSAATQPAPEVAKAAPAVSNPSAEVTLSTALTLRERVTEVLEKLAGVDRTELRITFSDVDAKALAAEVLDERLEIEPQGTLPGRVPLVVRYYHGEMVTQTVRVTVDVARRYLAVVAAQPIARGAIFAPGDLEMREVYVDARRAEPVTSLQAVLGQTAAAALKPGTPILPTHVQAPLLVHRGELMTVRCVAGLLVLRTTARAAEDGAADQVIQVKNEKSRETFAVKVTGPREGLAVEAESPVKPATGSIQVTATAAPRMDGRGTRVAQEASR